MSDQSLWYLENLDLAGVFCSKKTSEDQQDGIVQKRYEKGDFIFFPEEFSNKLFYIAKGRVKIGAFTTDGKEVTKTILGKGEVFGELSLVGETIRRDFAQAIEPTEVCILTVDEMKNMMRKHNKLGLFFMKLIGSRALEMERRFESLVFKDSRTRIVEFLKNLAAVKGQRVGYETLVRQFLTHQEIADLTATSRQTVTTVLNDLRNKNILIFNRKRLLIRDLDKLAAEAV